MSSLRYRADIDGLRAIAVSSVVVFHAWGAALPGGFVGVDVFFVISGYLITKILAQEIAGGRFSLLAFYERRIKRIIPALFMVLAASLAAGWVLLMPGDYEAMAWSAIYAVLSLSNVFFLDHTGYFDAAAQEMPLLHTWSLGVEEQYYLVWPLLLMGLFWVARRLRVPIALPVLVLAGGAFAYSVWLTVHDPKSAFYLATSRAYELAIGCLVALGLVPTGVLKPRIADAASIAGAGLIAYACLAFRADQPFPGLAGLMPTLGAALIILGGENAPGLINRLLALPPFVLIGKISYSLYLWHWPVLVFAEHYAGSRPTPAAAAVLVLLASVLAVLSYRYVERPARASTASLRAHYVGFAATGLALVALALAIVRSDGAMVRLPAPARAVAGLDTMWAWPCPETRQLDALAGETKLCLLGASWDRAQRHAILWGDSHAEHYAPLIDLVARDLGIGVVLYRNCPAIIDGAIVFRTRSDVPKYMERCRKTRAAALKWIAAEEDLMVILAAQWGGLAKQIDDGTKRRQTAESRQALFRQGLVATLEAIDPRKHRVVLIGQFPNNTERVVKCGQRNLSGLWTAPCRFDGISAAEVMAHVGPTDAILEQEAAAKSAGFTSASRRLCGAETCPATINGEFIYRDTSHIRRNLTEATKRAIIDRIGLGEALR
jgi:peptidoglycan/LPS O-acetylase OafA/YrhL